MISSDDFHKGRRIASAKSSLSELWIGPSVIASGFILLGLAVMFGPQVDNFSNQAVRWLISENSRLAGLILVTGSFGLWRVGKMIRGIW